MWGVRQYHREVDELAFLERADWYDAIDPLDCRTCKSNLAMRHSILKYDFYLNRKTWLFACFFSSEKTCVICTHLSIPHFLWKRLWKNTWDTIFHLHMKSKNGSLTFVLFPHIGFL